MTIHLHTPSERLALSRERLRNAMLRPPAQAGQQFATGTPSGGVNVFDLLKLAMPGAAVVIDALAQWWAGHSGQSANQLAGQVANEVLRPLAKRHPIALVAGAATLGALLIWSRPWRWALRPQLLSTLGPVLLSSVLASGVLQAWFQSQMAKASAPAPSPTPTPEPAFARPDPSEDNTG